MARQQYKTVLTSLRTSRKLASCDHAVARLYFHVLLASDAYGTLSGDPWDVFHEAVSGVRGYDVDSVSAGVDALVGEGLLERWEEAGSVWLYVTNHDELQSASQKGKRGARSLPTPPSQLRAQVGATPLNSPAAPTSQHDANSEPVAGTRRVSRGEGTLTTPPAPSPPTARELDGLDHAVERAWAIYRKADQLGQHLIAQIHDGEVDRAAASSSDGERSAAPILQASSLHAATATHSSPTSTPPADPEPASGGGGQFDGPLGDPATASAETLDWTNTAPAVSHGSTVGDLTRSTDEGTAA